MIRTLTVELLVTFSLDTSDRSIDVQEWAGDLAMVSHSAIRSRVEGTRSSIAIHDASVFEHGFYVECYDTDDRDYDTDEEGPELKTIRFDTYEEQQAAVAMLRLLGHDPSTKVIG